MKMEWDSVQPGDIERASLAIPEWDSILPGDIERASFAMIESELPHPLDPALAPIIKRVIHATADFSFADSLRFSPSAVPLALEALAGGCRIVTDTNMARVGIHQAALDRLGCEAVCFMGDPDVARSATRDGVTRASASMDRAASLDGPCIFAIGNAPTALLRLHTLIGEGRVRPALIIGVPVGFVNVVQSKERILQSGVPYIVSLGRRGGSAVAAAIVNALLYQLVGNGAM